MSPPRIHIAGLLSRLRIQRSALPFRFPRMFQTHEGRWGIKRRPTIFGTSSSSSSSFYPFLPHLPLLLLTTTRLRRPHRAILPNPALRNPLLLLPLRHLRHIHGPHHPALLAQHPLDSDLPPSIAHEGPKSRRRGDLQTPRYHRLAGLQTYSRYAGRLRLRYGAGEADGL